jgi:hypothetical protein
LPGKKKTSTMGVSHAHHLLCFKFCFYFIFTCKINTLVISEDGFTEDDGGNFRSVCVGTRWESAGPSMLLAIDGQLVEAFGFRWCVLVWWQA